MLPLAKSNEPTPNKLNNSLDKFPLVNPNEPMTNELNELYT